MFKKVKVKDSYFYEADYEQLKEELNWAFKTAENKFNHTVDFWDRGCLTRFFDFFFGDLAKNIVITFLKESEPTLDVKEYDKLRTDDFTEADLFDLMIDELEIEVKSSLEKYTNNLETIYFKRRIIIGLYKKNEKVPDYRVQVFYIPNNYRGFWDFMQNDSCNCGELSNHRGFIFEKLPNLMKGLNIYISGWINKNQEEIKMKNLEDTLKVRNNDYNYNKREYINFFIEETNDMDELLNDIKNKLQKD